MTQLYVTGVVSAWFTVGTIVLSYTERTDGRDMGALDALLILIAWPFVLL